MWLFVYCIHVIQIGDTVEYIKTANAYHSMLSSISVQSKCPWLEVHITWNLLNPITAKIHFRYYFKVKKDEQKRNIRCMAQQENDKKIYNNSHFPFDPL